jgi:hypothetical protein
MMKLGQQTRDEASGNLRDGHHAKRMRSKSPALPSATADETLPSPSDRRGEDRLACIHEAASRTASPGLSKLGTNLGGQSIHGHAGLIAIHLCIM